MTFDKVIAASLESYNSCSKILLILFSSHFASSMTTCRVVNQSAGRHRVLSVCRDGISYHPYHPGWCKIFGSGVKFSGRMRKNLLLGGVKIF